MTAQEPAVTGQGGEVLGEEAQQRVWSVTAKALRGDPDAADAVTHALAPVVAALVAQARADGAAEERERLEKEAVVVEHGALARASALGAGSDRWMDATEVERHAGGNTIITFADGMKLTTRSLDGSS